MGASNNRRLGLILLAVVLTMAGVAFASVPLYRMFCAATGLAGTTQRANSAPDQTPGGGVLDRTITVRFNTDTQPGLPWTFAAETPPITIKLGETAEAKFHVVNNSSHAITGVATYNVVPQKLGLYFNKVQCFCFEPHRLQPGEAADFPVLFFIDPALDQDPHLKDIKEVTLSYSFFEAKADR